MAIKNQDVEIRVSAVDETSKPLKNARESFGMLEDAVVASAATLDKHKGHPRDFSNAMKSAFAPLPGIAKDAVGKVSATLEGLEQDLAAVEDALSFKDVQMTGLQKAKAAIDAEREAVARRMTTEKQSEKQRAEAAKARAAEIAAGVKARRDEVREADRQIAAEKRHHDAIEKRLIANRKALEAPVKLTPKRQQALEEASVNDANALAASRNRMAQLVQARAASAALVEPMVQEQQAHKDLTAVAKGEAAKRIAAVKAEEDAIKKRDRALENSIKSAALERSTLEAKRTAILSDRAAVSDIQARAVAVQAKLSTTNDVRQVASGIAGGPDREARGMSALAAETRKAADAQRLLNGETRSGVPVFASLRSEIAGMIGLYAAYTAAVSQAGQVIEAFNTREAFTVAIGSAAGKKLDATAQWEYLVATANKYKFTIAGISDEYSKLVINSRGAGLSDEDSKAVFEGILAKARATNLTNEQIQNAFRALSQTVSKNQLYAEELRGQLAEAIPGAVNDMAKALGYGADRMAEFNRDMEAGTFKADAVVKYARYLMDQNSSAVEAAGGTFRAAVADLQNVLFETRLKLAEDGFMDGLKETVQELADFFKSDEGQAYMIRLASAANGVMSALASAAKNLDLIILALGAIAGGKVAAVIGGAFASVATAGATGAAGMAAMTASAGALATALGVLRVAALGVVRLLGGVPGLAIGAALALAQMSSSAKAAETVEINSAMERTKEVINAIRNAAVEANGDLERFRNLLTDAGVNGSKELAAAMADANKVMADQARRFSHVVGDVFFKNSKRTDLPVEVVREAGREILALNRDLKRLTYGDLEKRINALAKAYGLSASQVEELLGYAAEYDKQNRSRVTLLGVLQGRLEDVSEAELKGGIAAAKAAGDQKAYNEAMEALKKLTGDTNATEDFAKALADISKHANEAAKAVAGTAGEAKRLADIERTVRNAQLTNAARFLEKRYGDAGLTLRPSAELIGLIEGLNGTVMAAGANGQVGWVPSSPGGGQSYIANTSGRMENKNGRLVSSDPMLRGLTVSQAALLNAIAAPESGGAYNIRFGGAKGPQTFDLNGVHPNVRERNPANGTYSTAAGRYQFIGSTYRSLMGNAPFTPENQDKAALKNAEQAWARHGVKGVSLWDYLDKNGMDQTVRNALKPQWEGFVGNGGYQKAKNTYDASRSRYMASGVTVGSVRATGVSVGPDGSIVRAPAAGAAPTVNPELLTPEMKRALEIVSSVMPSLPSKASDALLGAVARNPGAADDMAFIAELKSGQLTRIADAIERVAGAESANAFRRETDIISQAQQADANADAFAAVKDTVEAMKFAKDDFADDEARSAAIIRETQEAIKKLTENGAALAVATGKPDDAQARAFIADQAAQRAQVEYGKELADQARKRAEDQAQFNKANETAIRDARQQAELAAITNDAERERLRIQQQIANEQADGGFTYTDAQKAARAAAEMAKFEADQAADKAKTAADQSKAVQQGLQDAKDQIALAGEQNELSRERLRIEQEIRRQEQESGVAMSDADRNALIQAQMDAYVAQNGQAIAERQHQAEIDKLQAKLDYLYAQLEDAREKRDTGRQAELRGEIQGTTQALLEAVDAWKQYNEAAGGPDAEKNILQAESLRFEIERNRDNLKKMSPEVEEISQIIQGSLNGAVDTFAKRIAQGDNAWDALKASVGQAVGQMLIDFGRMITQAVIADATMKMLGKSAQNVQLGGGNGQMPGGQGGNKAGSIISTLLNIGMSMFTGGMGGGAGMGGGTGGMTGGLFHDGGIIGDPSKNIDFIAALMDLKRGERPIIAMDGEEMLTRQDPRHRDNLGSAFARLERFHIGGIIGKGPSLVQDRLGGSGGLLGGVISKAMGDKGAAGASLSPINIINSFDEQDVVDRALSNPAGERLILNVISKNRSKLKGILG